MLIVKISIIKSAVIFISLFLLLSLSAMTINFPIAIANTAGSSLSSNYTYVNLQKVSTKNTSSTSSANNEITIALNNINPNYNKKFDLANMAPGDKAAQTLDLITNNNIDTNIKLEMKKTSLAVAPDFAEKLTVKITAKIDNNNENTIYTGSMSDFVKTPIILLTNKNDTNSQDILFNIEISLPLDTGNEYQGKSFVGDLQWSIVKVATAMNPHTSSENNLLLPFILSVLAMGIIIGLRKLIFKRV
jgi:hypothetical protein